MANGGLQQMMNMGFLKRKLYLNPNLNESENPSDCGFAKKMSLFDNIQIITPSYP